MIADDTNGHAELQQAHHSLFNLRCPSDGKPKFVVMRINLGEMRQD